MNFASPYALQEMDASEVEELDMADLDDGLVKAAEYQAASEDMDMAAPSAPSAAPIMSPMPMPAYGSAPYPPPMSPMPMANASAPYPPPMSPMPSSYAPMPAPGGPPPPAASAGAGTKIKSFFSSIFSKPAASAPAGRGAAAPALEKKAPAFRARTGKKAFIKKATTNMVSIDLGTLAEKVAVVTGDPAICKKCKVYFSQLSTKNLVVKGDEQTWNCEFCGTANEVSLEDEEIPKADSIDYLLEAAPTKVVKSDDESTIIFCIDISGSMCVTSEVAGSLKLKGKKVDLARLNPEGADQYFPGQAKDRTYISRLQCVQAALDAQIETLKKDHPARRVGLVCFNNDVEIIGDGTASPVTITGDKLNNFDALFEAGTKYSVTDPIKTTHTALAKRIWDLEESGTTALGPALVASIGMATKKGSKGGTIILCTDGLSNVGVGNMDGLKTEEETAAAEGFYRKAALLAKEHGIVINVVSIEGSECKMENLGTLSELTGGNVDIVNPITLSTNFKNVLANPIVATGCSLRMITHDGFIITDEDAKGSVLSREIGNVTADTKITLEYRNREAKELGELKIDASLKELPFQVQISFTRLDGAKYIRLITKAQAITSDRAKAEEEADFSILGAAAVQKAGHLAQKGDYGRAREFMYANQRLMHRAVKPSMATSKVAHYGEYLSKAKELDEELAGAETEEKSRGEAMEMKSDSMRERDRKATRKDKLSKAIFQAKKGK
eukprot:TRINITY_DN231_c0_g1_i2.p1 TRINITY_DN231_c0_g1~~TRINITY_DN231_c0_g1_i2.p1  ORF type:complete len:749 (-),score=157.94 TRINITY_DN231_c0_g1_i2:44-2227(-)